jgi:hypothetical protein
MAARPDVQRIALDAEAAVGGRRDLQLLVGVVEEGDVLAQRRRRFIAARRAEPAPSAPIRVSKRMSCGLSSRSSMKRA